MYFSHAWFIGTHPSYHTNIKDNLSFHVVSIIMCFGNQAYIIFIEGTESRMNIISKTLSLSLLYSFIFLPPSLPPHLSVPLSSFWDFTSFFCLSNLLWHGTSFILWKICIREACFLCGMKTHSYDRACIHILIWESRRYFAAGQEHKRKDN